MLSGLVGSNVQTQADVQCFQKELNFSFKEKSDRRDGQKEQPVTWPGHTPVSPESKEEAKMVCVCKILT